jgi:hypothetical protein
MTRHKVAPEVNSVLESQGIKNPGGNGHDGQSRGFNTQTAGLWGDNDVFNQIMKPMEQPSIGRELVHPGKDALEISMRTVLKNVDEAKVIMQLISWCREFDFEEGLKDIMTQLALYNSVGGYARDQFIQAITQTYRGTPYQGQRSNADKGYKQPKEEKQEDKSF